MFSGRSAARLSAPIASRSRDVGESMEYYLIIGDCLARMGLLSRHLRRDARLTSRKIATSNNRKILSDSQSFDQKLLRCRVTRWFRASHAGACTNQVRA